MKLTEMYKWVKTNPNEAMALFVEEISEGVNDMGKMMTITPVTMEDRHPHKRLPESTAKMLQFEKEIVDRIPDFWASTDNTDTTITQGEIVVATEYKYRLGALLAVPGRSFVKTTFNRRAWIKNEVYRTNVNFEGYAHWNAAVFYYVARKIMKISDDDVNLVLRTIPFNDTIAYRAIFAPKDIKLSGATHHASLLSPEKYRSHIIKFSSELSNEITCHRQNTGRRYSARDVSVEGADPETREIQDRITEIYERYRKTAVEAVKFQKGGE